MFGRATTLGLLALTFGIGAGGRASTDCIRFSEEARTFLAPLHGSWSGIADPTPLGRLPYDMDFTQVSETKTQGKSPTNGVAVHTWDFWYSIDGKLMLDFHTTFGNSRAEGLCVRQTDGERGYLFSGDPSVPLDIWIKVIQRQSDLLFDASIHLNDRLHVTITSRRD